MTWLMPAACALMLAAPAHANSYGSGPCADACTCIKYNECNIEQVSTTRACEERNHVCCMNSTIDAGGWADPTRAASAQTNVSSAREAGYGEFPWMAVILKEKSREAWTRSQYVGGAAILTEDTVLTAAHKVHGLDINLQLKVRAGELSRTEQEPHPYQERLVRTINIHEQYGGKFLSNDVAILRLRDPLDFSSPAVGAVVVGKGQPSPGADCVATGWGRHAYDLPYADRLKKIRTPPVLNRKMCLHALQAAKPRRRVTLHSTQFCAGGDEGEDTCIGDGGSPLVCRIQGNATQAQWAVFGLAAWGAGCGVDGVPAVYVDVPKFYSWIASQLSPRDELLDLCQKCAKVTKSRLAYSTCCSDDLQARKWCFDYVNFAGVEANKFSLQ